MITATPTFTRQTMNHMHNPATRPGPYAHPHHEGAPFRPAVPPYPGGPPASARLMPHAGASWPAAPHWPQSGHPGPPNNYSPPPEQGPTFRGWEPQTPEPVAPKRRRGRAIGAMILLVASAAAAFGAWTTFGKSGDEDAIKATMSAFHDAVAAGDVEAVTAQMCDEEAALLDGLQLSPGETASANGEPADEASVAVADIEVKGTAAAGTLTGRPGAAEKIYFRKEGEQWKVCSFAQSDFESAR